MPLDLTSARVLVTGGAGFIGSALVWALNRRGNERIVVCDLLGTSEKWRNLVPLRFEEYVEADDLLQALDEGALGEFDLVLHMGACSSTTERDASYLIRNNYEYTRALCIWALDHGTEFVYASSAATYGDGSAGMKDDAAEIERLRPLNMYGYSKQLFDLWARREGVLDEITGLKFFNVFGPNEAHKGDMRSMVHKAFGQIQSEGKVRLFRSYNPEYADGEQQRDFVYVKDAVEMTLHLASGGWTGLYNIGSGRANTWLELVRPVFKAMRRRESIEFVDMPEEIRGKYQYHTLADVSKLRETGYAGPFTQLEDAVMDYVGGYLMTGRNLGDEE